MGPHDTTANTTGNNSSWLFWARILAWVDLVPTGMVAGGTMIAGQFGWLGLFRSNEVLQGPGWKKQQTWLVLPQCCSDYFKTWYYFLVEMEELILFLFCQITAPGSQKQSC